jgi:hypothetical protein
MPDDRQLLLPFPETQQQRQRRKSKLSPQEIDALLEQSARGVEYLRKQLNQVFRLPRRSLRLR